jgi:hypothetical protein
MAAIISETFRKNNAKRIYDAISGSTETYYIGIGRNESWADDGSPTSFDVPSGTPYNTRDVLMNLIAMKKVLTANVSYVIPRVDLVTGSSYKSWDSGDSNCWYASTTGTLPCFAVLHGHLFLCVTSGSGTVSDSPSTSSTIGTLVTPGNDGYTWVRIQDAANVISHKLYTSQWYPVFVISSPSSTATAGKILSFKVVDGGAGYNEGIGAASINVYGDGNSGTNTTTTARTSGRKLASIDLPASNTGYTFANINVNEITGLGTPTTKPKVRAIVAPSGGFGYNNLALLPTWFLGFSALFNGDGDETDSQSWFITSSGAPTDYRQITLIKDPSFNRTAPGRGDEITTLSRASYSGATPVAGGYIQNTNGTKTYIDYVDTTASKIYFHQSYSSYGKSNSSPLVTTGTNTAYSAAGTSIGTVTLSNIVVPEYQQYTGEVIFYENRSPIVRNPSQAEDIKVVIQF